MTYISPPTDMDLKWESGEPPEIGWWPCSYYKVVTVLRYWDGKDWSLAQSHVKDFAQISSEVSTTSNGRLCIRSRCAYPNRDLRWAHRWWEKK